MNGTLASLVTFLDLPCFITAAQIHACQQCRPQTAWVGCVAIDAVGNHEDRHFNGKIKGSSNMGVVDILLRSSEPQTAWRLGLHMDHLQ